MSTLKKTVLGIAMAGGITPSSALAEMPEIGICSLAESSPMFMMGYESISWKLEAGTNSGTATLMNFGDEILGQVQFFRQFDTGWKFNVAIEDKIVGPGELVVLLMPGQSKVGGVFYDLEGSNRHASVIFEFGPANCVSQ